MLLELHKQNYLPFTDSALGTLHVIMSFLTCKGAKNIYTELWGLV